MMSTSNQGDDKSTLSSGGGTNGVERGENNNAGEEKEDDLLVGVSTPEQEQEAEKVRRNKVALYFNYPLFVTWIH